MLKNLLISQGIGENMSLRRAVIFNVRPTQYISWYMHGSSIIYTNKKKKEAKLFSN